MGYQQPPRFQEGRQGNDGGRDYRWSHPPGEVVMEQESSLYLGFDPGGGRRFDGNDRLAQDLPLAKVPMGAPPSSRVSATTPGSSLV
jgi:hypothetical protein